MRMKRFIWVVLILVCFPLVGCGREATPSAAEPVVEEPAKPEERVPEILDADVPERDPFAAAGNPTWQKDDGTVIEGGRNPFMAATGTSNWVAESGVVVTKGRDPFDQVPDEIEGSDPDKPLDPEEPVDPGDATVAKTVAVALQTTDRCWLDVFVDDVRVLRTNVPSGESLNWEAEREVRLDQVGRELAVLVNVNGKDFGSLASLVQRLGEDLSLVDREAGVEITVERRYPGGVLVGLKFTALSHE
jgi:hypothetical protein